MACITALPSAAKRPASSSNANLIGSYCTSLDMAGFSITLLKVDDETLTLWDAPVHTPALNWGN
ncbi:phosphoenolpyruvate-dihydroxyacetone phosphotransferase [Klebsiella pneumoniae]|uniref:Phosphoenolpyruvate-dihydroxyacetone phosphotransferase n=1 Tax=Klebsiella pneumoniae TaxID=573 RepID=A0A2X3ELT0_KLEPN|nr:phosphoenolpyruvate-dihydroxyacetone phosphotransferase [Klebsiella pneumoniae]